MKAFLENTTANVTELRFNGTLLTVAVIAIGMILLSACSERFARVPNPDGTRAVEFYRDVGNGATDAQAIGILLREVGEDGIERTTAFTGSTEQGFVTSIANGLVGGAIVAGGTVGAKMIPGTIKVK